MKKNVETVLIYIADILNRSDITWALGGSLLLHYEGYPCDVNDIDILVDVLDYEKVIDAIRHIPYVYMNSNEKYQTEHFFNLTINNVEIDIMLNFGIKHHKGTYHFPFNKSLISRSFVLENVKIYLSSVSEWEKAYTYMGREDKTALLKKGKHYNVVAFLLTSFFLQIP